MSGDSRMRQPGRHEERGTQEYSGSDSTLLGSSRRARPAFDGGDLPSRGQGLIAKLPSLSSRKVVKAFQACGWQVARQESSHIIMVDEGERATLSVHAD